MIIGAEFFVSLQKQRLKTVHFLYSGHYTIVHRSRAYCKGPSEVLCPHLFTSRNE